MKTCNVDNCDKKRVGQGYCSKHYYQFKKYGKVLERTRFDPNEIIVSDKYAKMFLYDKHYNIIAETIIDIDDVSKVGKYRWRLMESGYVSRTEKNKDGSQHTVYLHRFVMDYNGELTVDHKDRNRLNNTKGNLRIVSQQNNLRNNGGEGVYYNNKNSKWIANLSLNNKTIYLGSFESKKDAILARKEGEKQYWKRGNNNG